MAYKNNGSTEISKESLSNVCEQAKIVKDFFADKAVEMQQAYTSIKNNEELEGEEHEKLIDVVEKISMTISDVSSKMAKLEQITNSLIEFVGSASATTNKDLEGRQAEVVSKKMQVRESGN